MTEKSLVALLILLPLAAAALNLVVKEGRLRPLLVISYLVPVAASLVLLLIKILPGDASSAMVLPGYWDKVMVIAGMALLIYFCYVGVVARHPLVLGLGVVQLIVWSLFRLVWLPYGFEASTFLDVDLLSVLMSLVVTFTGALAVFCGLLRPTPVSYLPVMIVLPGAVNGLLFVDNLLWFFFFWQVVTLGGYLLLRNQKEAGPNALRALWVNLFSGLVLLSGLILAYRTAGTLSLLEIIAYGTVSPFLLLPLALLCLAGFVRAAQVPFQGWLLGVAHAVPVSFLICSGLIIQAGIYLVLRLVPAYTDTHLALTVPIFGAFVFMVVSLLAVSQRSAGKVLIYSDIAVMGLVISFTGTGTGFALAGAVALLMFYALTRGLILLFVGMVEEQNGSRDIEAMGGLLYQLPVPTALVIVGMTVLLLLPFVALFSFIADQEAVLTAGPRFGLVVTFMVTGAVAGVVYWTRWMGRLISRVPEADGIIRVSASLPGPSAVYPLLLLGAGVVMLSGMAVPFVSWLMTAAVTAWGGNPVVVSPWYWALPGLAVVFLPMMLLAGLAKSTDPPVYLGGESLSTLEPVWSIDSQPLVLGTGGVYWRRFFGERGLNPWINSGGIMLLAALFAGVIW